MSLEITNHQPKVLQVYIIEPCTWYRQRSLLDAIQERLVKVIIARRVLLLYVARRIENIYLL